MLTDSLLHDDFQVRPEAEAVSNARRRVMAAALAWNLPLSDEAFMHLELCAAEVITNAHKHTQATSAVSVHWTGSLLRVEVTDTNPALPSTVSPGVDAESGRGLLLVDALAYDWGTDSLPGGKTTWFEIACEDQPIPDQHMAVTAGTAQPNLDPTGMAISSTADVPSAARLWRKPGGMPALALVPRWVPARAPLHRRPIRITSATHHWAGPGGGTAA